MARARVNRRYLPGVTLPAGLEIEHDFARAVGQAGQLLVVVPSHAFREVLERAKPLLRPGQRDRLGHQGLRARHRQAAA